MFDGQYVEGVMNHSPQLEGELQPSLGLWSVIARPGLEARIRQSLFSVECRANLQILRDFAESEGTGFERKTAQDAQ
jgi:hypothetical protein